MVLDVPFRKFCLCDICVSKLTADQGHIVSKCFSVFALCFYLAIDLHISVIVITPSNETMGSRMYNALFL